jgi:ABC-type glycerol-3-phosphate transport system permease component
MGIEDDTRNFLVKILNTIAMVLIWMILNVFFGIYKDYGFFEYHLNWTNYLFYFFSITSLGLLIFYLRRKWKQ